VGHPRAATPGSAREPLPGRDVGLAGPPSEPTAAARAGLVGIHGRPFLDLEAEVDTSRLSAIDEEICMGLTQIDVEYTGGSLKWMGVVAPSVQADPYVDYGEVIERFSREEFVRFVSLAENPRVFDAAKHHVYRFGDETCNPLTARQMLYLKYRYGVYFPWKVAYHLLENTWWEDKNHGGGKGFSEEALEFFPKTVAFIRALPFVEIGRAIIFGLEANDHAPLHRDTEPDPSAPVAHCMSICPRGDKRFFLSDPAEQQRTEVRSRVYWFNDMDYHGVLADPFFRYSVRIDGVFDPAFVRALGACSG
jgi:hypothetical protein